MQTVLVLPSLQTPVPPVGGAEAALSPDGAFEASFEDGPIVAEGPVAPPVMLAMPVSPIIAVAATAAVVESPKTGIAGAADAAMTAATVATDTKVTDPVAPPLPVPGADVADETAVLPPVHRTAEVKHDKVNGDNAQGNRPADAGEAARGGGPSDVALAARSTVATAAWTATRPTGGAGGQAVLTPSEAVRQAMLDRPEGPGQAGVGEAQDTRSAMPELSGPATAPLRGTNPEAARALPVPPEGPLASPPEAGLPMEAPGPEVPKVVSGPDTEFSATQVTQAAGAGGAEADKVSPEVPPSTLGEAAKPTAAERELQPPESQARPGLWESMFSSLALPLSAVGEVARALRPVLTGRTDAVPRPASGEPAALVTPDQPKADRPGSEAEVTATTQPVESPKTAPPASSPAVAVWLQATPWMLPIDAPDHATGDEGLQTLVAPATMATAGGTSGPSATPALPSSPVPQVAAQMTAALSQSADGSTELALSPDELGHVRLRLEPDAANPDRMVVMITFERPETLDLFRRHAGELAEALRAAGYAGADIGFGQDQSGSGGSEGSPHRSPGWGMGPDQTDPAPALHPAPRLAAGASLDLRL